MLDLIRGGTGSRFSQPRFAPLFTHLETKAAGRRRRGRQGGVFCAGCGANLFRRAPGRAFRKWRESCAGTRPLSETAAPFRRFALALNERGRQKGKALVRFGVFISSPETLDPGWDPLIPALHARPPGPGALVAVPIVCHSPPAAPPVAFCSQTLPGVVWAGFGEGIVLLMKQSGHYTAREERPARTKGRPGASLAHKGLMLRVRGSLCFARTNPSGENTRNEFGWGAVS